MSCFIWFAYLDYEKKDKSLIIVWICSAILINPFIKIVLGRTIWNTVDIIWAVIILLSLRQDINDLRKEKD